MTKLEELIEEFCPDGVEYVKLGDVCNTNTPPTKIPANHIKDCGKFPVIDQGAEFISGYTDEEMALMPKCEYIIFGDHTEIVKYVDFAFCQGADGIKILTTNKCYAKYFYYCFENCYKKTGKYTRHWSVAKETTIPLPPLPIQAEIVRILDTFAELTAELTVQLTAELTARKKQYEYYRDKLLTFDREDEGVRWVRLGEVATVTRGNGLQKNDFTEEGVPCIHYGQIYTYYGTFTTKTKSFVSPTLAASLKTVSKGDIIIAVTSENIEDVCKCVAWFGDEDIVTGGHTAIIKHNQNAKYIAYWLQTTAFFDQKRKIAHGTKVIEVTPKHLENIEIPLPSLAEQSRIVSILDKFDKLTTSLTEGLPAEIAARKKQYEYYRDKLLTFKQKT